ncbi:ferric reductase like transmembrane component-domain-containing protein [Massariosphaeria phaeospora]|uniref:ferric-chelate reductase (NADPH) n=1 Tax=Massariosphaeria phaeospora TaxID=100035 RepID=A0A7C8M8Y7_9PLEO|nr:ferric reductase like transmembrane component-domain-containing protein [Massariosphaeria phaeospora]
MNMAWLTAPLALHGSRDFECSDFTPEQCDYYKNRWHFWYIADYVFALPTIAFFMSTIVIFILGHLLSSHVLGYRRFRGPAMWQRLIAMVRYLSYRGFHVKALRWNSAPVGVLLLGLAGTVFFFCMDLAPQPYYWPDIMYGGSPPLATRSGWMALACMPFVFATASKTNWITLLTGISHERLQVFHRWSSYAFFVLALLHTFPFIVYHVRWHDMEEHFSSSLIFYWTGIVALIFQAWLTFMSHSTIRSLLGYEFFKATHYIAVVVFMITFFWHCDYTLTSWDYFIATAAVYVPCFAYPWLRTIFEYGFVQKAQISVEDNGFTRIVLPAKFNWKPGQHCFLRFTGFGILPALSSHPFTICSSPSIDSDMQSELVFYVRHQRGFTAKLYQLALDQPGVAVPVQIDGPYGGADLQKFRDSDRLLVVAGGSGAGWTLPFIERFARRSSKAATQGVSGPLSLRVILATRDVSSRKWFLRTVGELLAKHSSFGVHVEVFLTGEAATDADLPEPHGLRRTTSSSDEIQTPVKSHEAQIPGREVQGRPPLALTIQAEAAQAAESGKSLGVFVCGPETMQNDVRNAVAAANLKILQGAKGTGVYLHSEHFSWA